VSAIKADGLLFYKAHTTFLEAFFERD